MEKYAIFMLDDDDDEEAGDGVWIEGLLNSKEEALEFINSLPDEIRKEGGSWEDSPWYKHDTHFIICEITRVYEPIEARLLKEKQHELPS